MKKILVTVAICTFWAAASGQSLGLPAYRFTLGDCLDYAMRNNYNHQSLKLSEDASADVLNQSKQERLPDLGASLSETYTHSKVQTTSSNGSNWGGSYGVNAGVVLYQGGAINTTIEQNKLALQRSAYNTSQYDNTLTIQILQAFLSVLGNEELLRYQQAVVVASAEQVRQGDAQMKAGTILPSDYLLLDAQLANDRNNVIDTQITRDNNLLALKTLLSMDPATDLEVIRPDTTLISSLSVLPSMDIALRTAIATMPDLKISQYDVDIASGSVKLAKSGYFPTLSLSGGLNTGHSVDYNDFGSQLSNRFMQSAGLSVSIPIYNNGRTRSRVNQSKIALQQAELGQKQTEISLAQSVTTQYQDVVSSYNRYKTTDIRQNAYLKSFEAYRAKFDAGAITPVDLLQQQNNYISALNDFIQSKYGFILKRKILDVYMGIPVTM